MTKDEVTVRYLERELRVCATEIHKKGSPLISIGARREACILQLNLLGYAWDHDKLEARKQR
jgi:hypothetical protein